MRVETTLVLPPGWSDKVRELKLPRLDEHGEGWAEAIKVLDKLTQERSER